MKSMVWILALAAGTAVFVHGLRLADPHVALPGALVMACAAAYAVHSSDAKHGGDER